MKIKWLDPNRAVSTVSTSFCLLFRRMRPLPIADCTRGNRTHQQALAVLCFQLSTEPWTFQDFKLPLQILPFFSKYFILWILCFIHLMFVPMCFIRLFFPCTRWPWPLAHHHTSPPVLQGTRRASASAEVRPKLQSGQSGHWKHLKALRSTSNKAGWIRLSLLKKLLICFMERDISRWANDTMSSILSSTRMTPKDGRKNHSHEKVY